MPTVSLSPIFNGYQAFSSAGLPLTFGTIETYQAGTSTPLATYTTAAGTVANANPITLLADGRPPQEIWLIQGSAYRFVLKDFLGNQIGTYDDIQGSDPAGTGAAILARLADTSSVSNGDALIGWGGITTTVAGVRTRYTTLAAAVVALGVTKADIEVSQDATVSSNITIASTCTLRLTNSAVLTINNGFTLTISGTFEGHGSKCFNQVGTGKVSFSVNAPCLFYPQWWGALANGVADDSAAIQSALDCASPAYGSVYIPPACNFKVTATLNSGNAALVGNGFYAGSKITYTGASNLFGNITKAQGIFFQGPGKATTAVGFLVVDGYRDTFQGNRFDGWGDGIKIAGSGQLVEENLFTNCGNACHVVKYSAGHGNDPTTTFTSRKNWYESSNNGLWIDSTGATSGFISCASDNDIFQLNTGCGLRVVNAGFPFTLINPHTEQNLNGGTGKAFIFTNSPITWIGGFQAAGETNTVDTLSNVIRYAYGGILATTPFVISNPAGSINAFKFDPTLSIPLTTIPAKAGVQKVEYVGGAYTDTTSARFDMYGGFGDSGFYYGNFVESNHNAANANGGILYFGAILKGATDTYTRRIAMDYTGTFYPNADNAQPLGGPSNRWSVVYAGTGAINTSDEREKEEIDDIPDAWLDAWAQVKWQRFKFKDAVTTKGDGARWHAGLIAQRVRVAFEANGIDPFATGLLCYDEWEARPEELDADGNVIEPARPAGNRYGIRYEEALSMECALMRRRLDKLEKS